MIKVRVPGGHSVYALPELETDRIVPWEQLRRVLGEWVGEVAVSANLVVLRTPPGCAHVVASALDRSGLDGLARHRRRRRHAAVRRRRDDHRRRAGRPAAGALRARSRRWLTAPALDALARPLRQRPGRRPARLHRQPAVRPPAVARRHRRLAGPRRRPAAGRPADRRRGRRRSSARWTRSPHELADRHVHVRPERRGHPHRRRAAGHRARRRGRRQAAHGAQPQRPDRHRPAAVVQARADRGRPARRRPRGRPAGPGRGRRRRLPPRLHARAAGPAGAAGPPPAGPRLGVRPATSTGSSPPSSASTSRRSGPGRWPGRRCRSTRRPPPTALGFGDVFANSLDAVSDRDFVAEALFDLAMVGIHLARARRGVGAVDERGVRLRPPRRRLRHRLVDDAAEEERRHRRAGARQVGAPDRQPDRAAGDAEGPAARRTTATCRRTRSRCSTRSTRSRWPSWPSAG